jgi:regulation of enolase protein 1 (concanavalin A-like superfamily)
MTLAGALDYVGAVTTGGPSPWAGQAVVTRDGVDAAQSGVLGNSQTTWMETRVSGPGTLSFWWKVSSEAKYDILRFWAGGVEVGRISGEVGWEQCKVTVAAGMQTLRWSYTKDGALARGQDAAWVDQVSFAALSLPAPWQATDIGNPGVVGSASASGGLYTVSGSGYLGSIADTCHFVYQPLTADGEIRVRLNSVEPTGPDGRIGVMIRESLTSNARFAFLGVSPTGTFCWQHRQSTGSESVTVTTTMGDPPYTWLRLSRAGDTLQGELSTTGTNWVSVNTASIAMATNIYVGFAVASGSSGTLNGATFTNVTVLP